MQNFKKLVIQVSALMLVVIDISAQNRNGDVRITGAMRNVMWQGEVQGKISLDTITPHQHLFGMGPAENLNAELLILNGRSYKSYVLQDGTMKVEETFNSKAPFFGYAHIAGWETQSLPIHVRSLADLEKYLEETTGNRNRPFFFRLEGKVSSAKIHIVNLPPGTKVSSPQDAHRGRVFYNLNNEEVEILGFFSTTHQSVFTHHDSFLHMHLITSDKQKMGHLDELVPVEGKINLFLPVD